MLFPSCYIHFSSALDLVLVSGSGLLIKLRRNRENTYFNVQFPGLKKHVFLRVSSQHTVTRPCKVLEQNFAVFPKLDNISYLLWNGGALSKYGLAKLQYFLLFCSIYFSCFFINQLIAPEWLDRRTFLTYDAPPKPFCLSMYRHILYSYIQYIYLPSKISGRIVQYRTGFLFTVLLF